jgi:hypothetical protein
MDELQERVLEIGVLEVQEATAATHLRPAALIWSK